MASEQSNKTHASGAKPSLAQQRLWVLEQLQPTSSAYNNANIIRITGEVSPHAVGAAVQAVVDRHAPLRSHFVSEGGQPGITYGPAGAMCFAAESLEGDPETQPARAHEAARSLAGSPMHLESGPLARWRLFTMSDTEHWLVYVAHHAVSDRWSVGVLVKEIGALLRGEQLASLPTTYQRFADEQRAHVGSAAWSDALAFFSGQLGERSPVLKLPTDRPRPAERREHGRIHRRDLSRLHDPLKRCARDHRATPYMIALTTFQEWLGHMTGDWDPVTATFVAGRERSDTRGLIGLFVNTLALRFELSDNPTFREAVSRTRTAWLAAQRHASLPFEMLIQTLAPERDLSVTPVAQVAFNYHNVPMPRRGDHDVQLELLEVNRDASRYDLTLTLRPSGSGLVAEMEYDTDLFDEQSVARFAAHYEHLLEFALATPERPVRALPLAGQPGDVMPALGRVDRRMPTREGVLHRVSERAAAGGEVVAIRCGDRSLSYAELDLDVRSMARHLSAAGVAAGDVVAVCLPRSERLVVTALALWAVGAAYLPLDQSTPPERREMMLDDAGATAVVGLPGDASETSRIPWIDPAPAVIADDQPCGARRDFDPDALAYVIYTSGSTGRPKGVRVRHGNISALLAAFDVRLEPRTGFCLLAVTTFAFDIAVLELFWPLWRGAELRIADEATSRDARLLAAQLSGVDVFQATPATMRMLVDVGYRPVAGMTVLCGGEALPAPLAAELTSRGATLHNVYGPTETTVWSTSAEVDPASGKITLGDPLPGEWVYVMDDAGLPVAPGAAGELWIGGQGVAEGYHRRAELSAQRFVPDPAISGARCYRTGDVVRQDADGRLLFLGRADGQVKLRGHRIELGELEARMSETEGVAEVVALVHGDDAAARLVVYFRAVEGHRDLVERMSTLASATLPPYMRPAQYVEVERFPLTTSGKIQRRALRPPAKPAGEVVQRPRTTLEEKIAGIWTALLDLEEVSVHDDFFAVGGTSLLGVRMLEEVRSATGLSASLAELVNAPTLSSLADVLRKGGASDGASFAVLKQGRGPTLWMLHGVRVYKSLADALPEEIGMTGTYSAPELDSILGRTDASPTTLALVNSYVETILHQQSRGPYRLGGFSFGGVLAYECARVLSAQGHEVELVVLVDANLPYARSLDVLGWLRYQLRRLVSPGPQGAVRASWRRLARRLRPAADTAADLDALNAARLRLYHEAIADYRPGRYDGETLLIRSVGQNEYPGKKMRRDLGWGGVACRLKVEEIRSLHLDLVNPPAVDAVAAAIARGLSTGVRPAPSPSVAAHSGGLLS